MTENQNQKDKLNAIKDSQSPIINDETQHQMSQNFESLNASPQPQAPGQAEAKLNQ